MNDQITPIISPQRGDFTCRMPEWGNTDDIRRLFGLRRGTVQTLIKTGKVRTCSAYVAGTKRGLRLIEVESVRQFIESEWAKANPTVR